MRFPPFLNETATAELQSMRIPYQPFLQTSGFAALSVGLVSCAERVAPANIDDPVFGPPSSIRYSITPSSGNLHVRDLAYAARVLRRYKTLKPLEREVIKLAVEKRLRAIVALEIQEITKEREGERQQLRRSAHEPESRRKLSNFDSSIREMAVERVGQRLGQWIAVPLLSSSNSSPVAFARIDGAEIEVPADAGEIDRPLSQLVEGSRVRTLSGVRATFLSIPPVPVAPPK